MIYLQKILIESWGILLESSIYMIFGLLLGGLLKVFLSPEKVALHLGKGSFLPVIKASLFGIPMPICSCGVLPAAASLKKQGANNGATTAFLISTPESGVDSISITYALLGPVMAIARPVSAFITATVAGLLENIIADSNSKKIVKPSLKCVIDNCCDGKDCPEEVHKHHHTVFEKINAGIRYAFTELWDDIALWFIVGIFLGGIITAFLPNDLISEYLGGGLQSMLIMLVFGIPIYICATASTPIAAALILKGVSPGAALVFLLAGPATNITSLTVVTGILGKRATAIYLASIAVISVLCGLALDEIYSLLGISATAIAGQATELIPEWLKLSSAIFIIVIMLKPVYVYFKGFFTKEKNSEPCCSDENCNG